MQQQPLQLDVPHPLVKPLLIHLVRTKAVVEDLQLFKLVAPQLEISVQVHKKEYEKELWNG